MKFIEYGVNTAPPVLMIHGMGVLVSTLLSQQNNYWRTPIMISLFAWMVMTNQRIHLQQSHRRPPRLLTT